MPKLVRLHTTCKEKTMDTAVHNRLVVTIHSPPFFSRGLVMI